MTSIYDIPYQDIKIFLDANNKSFSNKNDAYDQTLKLLKNKKAIGHTMRIIEWIIAHNLFVNKVDIPHFTNNEIDNMKQNEINELARLLTMKGNNRENIKNILRFLHKLDNENIVLLPEINDIILNLANELEVKNMIEEIRSYGLGQIIYIFESYSDKKFLRKFLYDNMEKIINNYIIDYLDNHEKQNFNDYDLEKINNLIISFLEINELSLAKRVLDIVNSKDIKFHDHISVYSFLLEFMIDYREEYLLENFFKSLNDDDLIEQSCINVINIFRKRAQDKDKYVYVIKNLYIPLLKVAIKFRYHKTISSVINHWKNYKKENLTDKNLRIYSYDSTLKKIKGLILKMDNLVQEAKDLTHHK